MASTTAQIDVVIDPGKFWELGVEVRNRFNCFLENERLQLLEKIPGLELPKIYESVQAGIATYMSADSPKFRNRKTARSFLERVRNNLEDPNEKAELDALTKSGKICIQADLEPNEQLQWTQDLAQFMWNAKWIPRNDEVINLQSYLEENLSETRVVPPRIGIMKESTFDAWGIAQSLRDREFFASVRTIKDMMTAMEGFDPNDSTTFSALGYDFEAFIKRDPFNAANLLMSRPSIYISNGWPPDGIVELLVHEYGHIYRRLNSQHYTGNDTKLIWLNDEVHEEAAAEAFAWINLQPLYKDFPEIEIFHISKLMFMNQFSPNNFHYLGAAALQDFFHTPTGGNLAQLKDFDKSEDFQTYLEKNKISTLVDKGNRAKTTIRAVYTPLQ